VLSLFSISLQRIFTNGECIEIMKTVVLFVSHFINENYLKRYFKLVNDLADLYDVYWLFQTDNGISDEPLRKQGVCVEGFTIEDLNTLNYSPIDEYFYGSEHFLDEIFFHHHPEYDFYWLIEYDVVFTGNWRVLFDAFHYNKADFLSSHITFYDDCKDWRWWSSLSFNKKDKIESHKWVKSFNPIHRYSRSSLEFLDTYLQREGNSGFSETLPVTGLYNNGFSIIDFGGTGRFVPSGYKNRFYRQSDENSNETMRWRPEFSLEEIESIGLINKLFHPVKE